MFVRRRGGEMDVGVDQRRADPGPLDQLTDG